MHFPRLAVLAAAFVFLNAASPAHAELSEEQMRHLFSSNISQEELEKAVVEGQKAGMPAQVAAEAKLVWGLRHQDAAFMEKSLPELEAAAKDFKAENSVSLGSKEDFLGLVSYIKAMVAMKKGNDDDFKKHITEAFWLSPEQAQLFAQAVQSQRTKKKMASVTVDLKGSLTTSKGEPTSLAAQLGKNKAIYLDFWASWCGPCIAGMPELKKRAAYLSKHGITVAGMNTEADEAIAEKTRTEKGMDLPWLVETKDKALSDLLGISTLPRVVLLSPEGKVLFNGFADEPELWTVLKTLDPAIEPLKAE